MNGYIKINRVFPTIDMEFIEENNMEKKFKCKDEVLVRYNRVEKMEWTYGIFSHETKDFIVLCGDIRLNREFFDIIPFDGNEHLVGNYDAQEEEIVLEIGTKVMSMTDDGKWVLCVLDRVTTNGLYEELSDGSLYVMKYIVPFSKFNPNDMEATNKEILTVRNGKLVKANLK